MHLYFKLVLLILTRSSHLTIQSSPFRQVRPVGLYLLNALKWPRRPDLYLNQGFPYYSTKGHVAAGYCSNQASTYSLTNQLSEDSVQLIKWLLRRSLVHLLVEQHDWSTIFPIQPWHICCCFWKGMDMRHLCCFRSPMQSYLSGLSLKISDLVQEFKTQTSLRPSFFGNSVFYTGEGGI